MRVPARPMHMILFGTCNPPVTALAASQADALALDAADGVIDGTYFGSSAAVANPYTMPQPAGNTPPPSCVPNLHVGPNQPFECSLLVKLVLSLRLPILSWFSSLSAKIPTSTPLG